MHKLIYSNLAPRKEVMGMWRGKKRQEREEAFPKERRYIKQVPTTKTRPDQRRSTRGDQLK